MEDELKELKEKTTFIDEINEFDEEDLYPFPTTEVKKNPKRFLGMSPGQLFVVSIEFFLMILIFGLFFLIVTNKIVLPF